MHVGFLEDNVARVPVAGIKLIAKQRRDFFAKECLTYGNLERIQHCAETGERAHAPIRLHVLIVRIRCL